MNGIIVNGCKTDDGALNNFKMISYSANSKKIELLPPHSRYARSEDTISAVFRIFNFIKDN